MQQLIDQTLNQCLHWHVHVAACDSTVAKKLVGTLDSALCCKPCLLHRVIGAHPIFWLLE